MNEIKFQQANELSRRIAGLVDAKQTILRQISDMDKNERFPGYGIDPSEKAELIDLARKAFVAGIDPKIEEAKAAFEQL